MYRHDPIIEDIHRRREEHAAKFNYDLNDIIADIQRQAKRINPKARHFSLKPKKFTPAKN